jgi:hypothetical protein
MAVMKATLLMRLYSLFPSKYCENRGRKDIGLNDWNQGRTQEIKERYVHLGGDE